MRRSTFILSCAAVACLVTIIVHSAVIKTPFQVVPEEGFILADEEVTSKDAQQTLAHGAKWRERREMQEEANEGLFDHSLDTRHYQAKMQPAYAAQKATSLYRETDLRVFSRPGSMLKTKDAQQEEAYQQAYLHAHLTTKNTAKNSQATRHVSKMPRQLSTLIKAAEHEEDVKVPSKKAKKGKSTKVRKKTTKVHGHKLTRRNVVKFARKYHKKLFKKAAKHHKLHKLLTTVRRHLKKLSRSQHKKAAHEHKKAARKHAAKARKHAKTAGKHKGKQARKHRRKAKMHATEAKKHAKKAKKHATKAKKPNWAKFAAKTKAAKAKLHKVNKVFRMMKAAKKAVKKSAEKATKKRSNAPKKGGKKKLPAMPPAPKSKKFVHESVLAELDAFSAELLQHNEHDNGLEEFRGNKWNQNHRLDPAQPRGSHRAMFLPENFKIPQVPKMAGNRARFHHETASQASSATVALEHAHTSGDEARGLSIVTSVMKKREEADKIKHEDHVVAEKMNFAAEKAAQFKNKVAVYARKKVIVQKASLELKAQTTVVAGLKKQLLAAQALLKKRKEALQTTMNNKLHAKYKMEVSAHSYKKAKKVAIKLDRKAQERRAKTKKMKYYAKVAEVAVEKAEHKSSRSARKARKAHKTAKKAVKKAKKTGKTAKKTPPCSDCTELPKAYAKHKAYTKGCKACPSWAAGGYCTNKRFAPFMQRFCRRSCEKKHPKFCAVNK